ncbi:MAG: glycosyltransferase family 2 protein [Chloroflexi bacterium]|nr:glycosyltransferase family 2 protein [Chloroflexota bacterium]
MSPRKKTTVDLVIPVYNEAGVVAQTHARIRAAVDALPYVLAFLYVDDGSSDTTLEDLRAIAASDARVRVLSLSRNFGHQAALSAGLDASRADAVVSLDGDGQHPPEMIGQMLDLIAQGYDIVQGQRAEDAQLGRFKKWTSGTFYKILNAVSGTRVLPGAADFRAMSRRAVDALKVMPEYHRFLRGMVSWIGFKSAILPYHQEERKAGVSKYSLGKMVRLASDAVFSFSLMPLYIGLSAGVGFIGLAILQLLWVAYLWLTNQSEQIVPGWSSLMAVLLIASGIVMILLGFVGVYVGYIFQEVKRRPIYLIKEDSGGDK